MTKISNSQILARGSPGIRILTILAPEDLSLVLRPHTPVIYRVLVGRTVAFTQEIDADGTG